MARIKVEEFARRDRRFRDVAEKLIAQLGTDMTKWPDFAHRYVLGTMLEVWGLAYARGTGNLRASHVNEEALIEGFCELLASCELADLHGAEHVRLRGSTRIPSTSPDVSAKRSEAGRRGGKRAVQAKREANLLSKPRSKFASTKNIAESEGLEAKSSKFASTRAPTEAPLIEGATGSRSEKGEKTDQPVETEGPHDVFAYVRTAIDLAFASCNSGSKPTWSANKQRGVRSLIKLHGAEEVIARARNVWSDNPPEWPKTWDVSTLVQHFDKAFPAVRRVQRGIGRFEPTPGLDYSKPPWEE